MHPSPAASAMDKGQVPLAACAAANDVDGDDVWDLNSAVRLEGLERVRAKRRLLDFLISCRAKIRKVLGIVAAAFAFFAELANQESPVDTGTSAELVPVNDALVTTQIAAKKTKDQPASLKKKHNAL